MGIAYNTSIVSDGLVFALDAANLRSYSGSGLTAFSLTSNFLATLTNGVGFGTTGTNYFIFDGVDDNIPFTILNYGTTLTIETWANSRSFSSFGMIFGFSDPNEKCLGGMRGLFDIPTINKINDTIKILKENGIFNDPVLLVQVAAAIYYVTKTNLGVIKEYTGISPDTIRKNVLIIKNFYKTI